MLRCTPFLLFDGNCAEAMSFYETCLGMASPASDPILGNMSALFVLDGGYDELRTVFDKLAAAAEKEHFQELHDMPFGTYGQFYDRYGIQWIFNGDSRNQALPLQDEPPRAPAAWRW